MESDRRLQQAELDGERTLPLSREAIAVLQAALEEAASYGRGQYIDTADLLIGISLNGELGEKLRKLGVTVESIRDAKQELGGCEYFNRVQPPIDSTAVTTWRQLPRTQRMHKIGVMVTESAIAQKKVLVDPIDILGVIVKEGHGVGARVLNRLEISREMLFPDHGLVLSGRNKKCAG